MFDKPKTGSSSAFVTTLGIADAFNMENSKVGAFDDLMSNAEIMEGLTVKNKSHSMINTI